LLLGLPLAESLLYLLLNEIIHRLGVALQLAVPLLLILAEQFCTVGKRLFNALLFGLGSLAKSLKLPLLCLDLEDLFLELMNAAAEVLDEIGFHVVEKSLGLLFLLFDELLLRNLFLLLSLRLVRKVLRKVGLGVLFLVVLAKVSFTLEKLGTVVALHGSNLGGVTVFGNFDEVLVGSERFGLHLVFFFEVRDLRVVLLDLLADALGRLNCIFILHVQCPSEALQVVLGVHKVLNAHL